MSLNDNEDAAPFNSTASATKAPPSYFSAPTSDSILNFIDKPFETWQSTFLFALCMTALGSCTIFLAIRYAQVLRFKHEYAKTPLALEAQKTKMSHGSDADDESPVTSFSPDGNRGDVRWRPRARYFQPKSVAIGGVQEGKIAQRRTSRSRSVGRDITSTAP